MRVGIHGGGPIPDSGGAYTYITEVLGALSRMQADCGHELILCHDSHGEHIARAYPNFQALDISRENAELAAQRDHALESLSLFRRGRRFLRRLRSGPEPLPAPRSWEEIYARERIEFLLHLTPCTAVSPGIPFATTVWDVQHRVSPWFPEVSVGGEWEQREAGYALLRQAAFIYTGTEQGRDDIASFFQIPSGQIRVLPFAVPGFALSAAERSPLPDVLKKFNLTEGYLFYPAQFWAHKNHVLILEACRIIRQRGDWNPIIVFVGSDKSNLQHVRQYAAGLDLDAHTRILGFVDQTELVELYRGAHCLAFPTFFGPDNLPPLEAFAVGCPVVASDVPGAREQLGEAAMLFPPTDAAALADAIMSLRDVNIRRRFINAGQVRAAQYSWDDYARGILESLNEFSAVRRAWP